MDLIWQNNRLEVWELIMGIVHYVLSLYWQNYQSMDSYSLNLNAFSFSDRHSKKQDAYVYGETKEVSRTVRGTSKE